MHLTETASPGGVSKLIDDFKTQDLHRFFDSLIGSASRTSLGDSDNFDKFVSALRTKQDANEALNNFRLALGPWYSSVILADLCALDPNETNIEKRLEQRMRAMVQEALAWVPDGRFSQVVLTIQTPNTGNTEKSEVWFCSCVDGPNAQADTRVTQFDALTENYVSQHGTSALLKLHLRADHRIRIRRNTIFKHGRSLFSLVAR